MVTDKRPSPPGARDKVEVTVRLVLPRALMEQISARAIREGKSIELVILEILEGAGGE